MGTHPIFESDFDCLTDRNQMVIRPDITISTVDDNDEWTPATETPRIRMSFKERLSVLKTGYENVRRRFRDSPLPKRWTTTTKRWTTFMGRLKPKIRPDKKDEELTLSDRISSDSTKSSEISSIGGEPVHNMSHKELQGEMYFGYFLFILTSMALVFLIHGYLRTREIPMCLCNKNETDLTTNEIEFCQTAPNLTETEISHCDRKFIHFRVPYLYIFSEMDSFLLTDFVAAEDVFAGNCTINLEIFKFG